MLKIPLYFPYFWMQRKLYFMLFKRTVDITFFGLTTARDQLEILFTPQRTLLNKNHFEAEVSAWLKLKRGAEPAGALPRSQKAPEDLSYIISLSSLS